MRIITELWHLTREVNVHISKLAKNYGFLYNVESHINKGKCRIFNVVLFFSIFIIYSIDFQDIWCYNIKTKSELEKLILWSIYQKRNLAIKAKLFF